MKKFILLRFGITNLINMYNIFIKLYLTIPTHTKL